MSDELNVKTDWNENDRITPIDVNRIEGNIKTLALTQDNMAQQISSDNALINWNFTNPVNTGGQSIYTASGQTIDGWDILSNSRLEIVDDGIVVTRAVGGTGQGILRHPISNPQYYIGKTVTASIDVAEVNTSSAGFGVRIAYKRDGKETFKHISYDKTTGIRSYTIDIPEGVTDPIFIVGLPSEATGGLASSTEEHSIKLRYVKLELGKVSTLANDIPPNYNIQHLAVTGASPTQSNDNILINWDFRTPPVNQRGKNEYTGQVYSIDMWKSGTTGSRTTLQNGHIKVERTTPGSSQSSIFKQIIEFPEKYKGKIVTLSAIIRNNNIVGAYFYMPAAVGIRTAVIPVTNEFVLLSQTFTLDDTFSELAVILNTPTIVGDIDIQAIKLELGSISTLINDPPMNYGATLAQCQRYQLLCTTVSARQSTEVLPNIIYFDIPVPVTMRAAPTAILLSYLEDSSTIVVRDMSGADQTDFTLAYKPLGATIRVIAQKWNHGLTDAVLGVLNVLFDANM